MQSPPAEPIERRGSLAESAPDERVIVLQPARLQALTWVIAAALVVIAVCLVMLVDRRSVAHAQSVSHAGARGVFAFTGQLTKNTYGVFLVDVDTATVWCYEYVPGKPELRLVAGRTWTFDRYLKNFNAGSPSPEEIRELVEQQRALEIQSQMGTAP